MTLAGSYADRTQLAVFAPAKLLTNVSDATQDAELISASAVANGYISARCATPLTEYGTDLARHVCNIASYNIAVDKLAANTNNPVFRMKYDDAMRWLRDVSKGLVSVSGGSNNTAPVQVSGFGVSARDRREL